MGAYFEQRGALAHWRYDFVLLGERYHSPRGYPTRQECLDAENALRRTIRRRAVGLETAPVESPTFGSVADKYLPYITAKALVTDVDTVRYRLGRVLGFFGAKPLHEADVEPGMPYHNLRLRDVIDDPSWLTRFDAWMATRGLAGATKNRYRSACSKLYWFAMLPEMRAATGVTSNPFRGLLRDTEYGRELALDADQIRALVGAAPPWLALAIAIAVLAPKLRLSNILELRWNQIDAALTWITIRDHKIRRRTRKPLVSPVVPALRAWLLHVRPAVLDPSARLPLLAATAAKARVLGPKPLTRFPGTVSRYSDKDVGAALAAACDAVGLLYGAAVGGVTFHTFRHSALSLLAGLGVPDGLRKDVAGHLSIQTTQGYTHLQPLHQVAPLAQLAAAVALPAPAAEPPKLTVVPRRTS